MSYEWASAFGLISDEMAPQSMSHKEYLEEKWLLRFPVAIGYIPCKITRMNEDQPLRHGWGGDMKRRDQVLAQRRAYQVDADLQPDKFDKSTDPRELTAEDFALLALMSGSTDE